MRSAPHHATLAALLSTGLLATVAVAAPPEPEMMSVLNLSISSNADDSGFDGLAFDDLEFRDASGTDAIADDQPPVLIPEQAVATQEKIQERYSDGKIHIERWVSLDASGNFVNHGPWKQFNREGQLIKSGSWNLGQRDGEWFQTLSSAQASRLSTNLKGYQAPFTSTATFKDGEVNGSWVVTDHRKNMVVSWEYTDGDRDGISLWFTPTGGKRLQVSYTENKPSGAMFVWNGSTKDQPKQYELVRGMELKTETKWHSKTKRQKGEEFTYLVPSTMQIASQSWDASYLKYNENTDAEPIRHGEYIRWYRNGVMAHKGSFQFGEPTGEAEWWHTNGQRQVVGKYADGQPGGQWVWWHDNGMRKISGEYYAGTQVGLWRSWTVLGQLAAVEQKLDAEQIIASEQPQFEDQFTEFDQAEEHVSTLNGPIGR